MGSEDLRILVDTSDRLNVRSLGLPFLSQQQLLGFRFLDIAIIFAYPDDYQTRLQATYPLRFGFS